MVAMASQITGPRWIPFTSKRSAEGVPLSCNFPMPLKHSPNMRVHILWDLLHTCTTRGHSTKKQITINDCPDSKVMGPTWGPYGSCRHQMGPMLAPWTFLSGSCMRFARSALAMLYVEYIVGRYLYLNLYNTQMQTCHCKVYPRNCGDEVCFVIRLPSVLCPKAALTHCDQVTLYGDIDLGRHWIR